MTILNFIRFSLYLAISGIVATNLISLMDNSMPVVLVTFIGIVIGVMWLIFAAIRMYQIFIEMYDDIKYRG